jgi:hypothetical protein
MSSLPQPLLPTILGLHLGRLPSKEAGESPIVVSDTAVQEIQFNVMPDRPVTEMLRPTEYRVWHRQVEAEFSREYFSSMINSPDHLIFLTALIQVQRISYIYMCFEFGLPYEPHSPEKLKIWPTCVKVAMPQMVTEKRGLVHRLKMKTVRRRGENRFFAESESDVNGIITIEASALVYLL